MSFKKHWLSLISFGLVFVLIGCQQPGGSAGGDVAGSETSREAGQLRSKI